MSKPPRDLSGPHHGGMVLNYARQALRPIGCALGHYNFISESTTRPRPPRCSASARRCTLAHPTPQAQSDFPISPRARSRLPGACQCHHHTEGFAGAAAGPRRPPTTSPQNALIFQHRRPPLLPPPRSSPAVRLGCGHSQCPLPESGRDFRGGGAREMLVPSPRARASSDRSETGVPRNGEKPRDNPETDQRQTRDRGRHPWYTPSSGQCAHSGQCTRPNRRRAPRLRASIRRGGRCRPPPIRVLGLPSRLSSARPVRPDFRSAPHRPLLCSGDRSELLGVSTSTELAKGPSTSFPRGQCSEFYSTGPATSGMPILRSASTWVKSRVA